MLPPFPDSDSSISSLNQNSREDPVPTVTVDNSSNILQLFKDQPTASNSVGPGIHEELVVRWTAYLKEGINADTRKTLVQKYPIPENCTILGPPLINEEVKSILPSQAIKNDHFLSTIQGQLGSSLSILGSVLSKKLTEPDKDLTLSNDIVETLVDAGQLLTNIHHAISLKRKFEINPFLNEDSRLAANKNPTDEFLFGKDFLSKFKSCQDVKKAGEEIKKNTKKTIFQAAGPSGLSRNLNYQHPASTTRMKEKRRVLKEKDRRIRTKPQRNKARYPQQEKVYHPYEYRSRKY